jgi:acyl-CoA dehydrogenase
MAGAFETSMRGRDLHAHLSSFIEQHVRPGQATYEEQKAAGSERWVVPPIIEALKIKARSEGLWNLFLADPEHGAGLSNIDYAPLAELMGHIPIAAEVFNCSAPDTGNMELLHLYGNDRQKELWLKPLLSGEIRSGFMMTEPDVASSDATNVATETRRDGADYVINGRKWWITNAGDPRCRVFIVMGKTDPTADTHRQQSMILVPADTKGVRIKRMLTNFGFDDAPSGHAEIVLEDVRVPAGNLILGEGRGFEIAQGRLGPGRIHHCMRQIGAAEEALTLMCRRLESRVAFGKPLARESIWQERVANARIEIEMARLLTLNAAMLMDLQGPKAARKHIAMIKVAAPRMTQMVADMAMQAFGAAGLSQDTVLPFIFTNTRALRFADGPDEVHLRAIARHEFEAQSGRRA